MSNIQVIFQTENHIKKKVLPKDRHCTMPNIMHLHV